MKYATPEVTALGPALSAVQSIAKYEMVIHESPLEIREPSSAYADWEN